MSFAEQKPVVGDFSGLASEVRLKTDRQVLNLEHLSQYTSGDVELEQELFGLFKQQAVLQLENISSASCQGDWEMAVHTLKGSARSIGAEQVANAAAELEKAGFCDLNIDNQQQFDALEQAVAECLEALELLL